MFLILAVACGATCGEGTKLVDGVCVADSGGEDSGADTGTDTGGDSGTDTGGDTGTDTGGDSETDKGDADGDGWSVGEDCDDADASVYPGAPESADGQDEDCDGWTDEWEVCPGTGDFDTIQPALDAASDGQLVLVCPGTYAEHLDFGGTDARLIAREGPEVTILDGGRAYTVVTFAERESADALIEGFTIQHGAGESYASDARFYRGGGIDVHDASPTIRGNWIRENEAALGAAIYAYGSLARPTIVQNRIEENEATSGGSGPVTFYYGTSGEFSNNVVANNVADGIAGGLSLAMVAVVEVYNNTFYGNEARSNSMRAAHLYLYADGSAIIRNNIFAYAVDGYAIGASSEATAAECAYNDYFENDEGAIYNTSTCDSSTNLDVDPWFANRTSADFTLQAGSPCIDAGDPDGAFADPDGTRNDLGAYGGPEGSGW